MRPPKPVYSYFAAAAFALIILFTFFVFRDWGPQGVVRRFHIAATRGDAATIDSLCIEGAGDPTTIALVQMIESYAASGSSFEIVNATKNGDETLVAVEYRHSNGMIGGGVWFVRQTERDWRVNCRETLHYFVRPGDFVSPKGR